LFIGAGVVLFNYLYLLLMLELLKKGITTIDLIEVTNDPLAVRKAFELGAKIHGFKEQHGIKRGVLKISKKHEKNNISQH
jgi:hypothetical protein